MKKILALALAAVMVMALCGVAFAADTGTITITPPSGIDTTTANSYKIYKVFDATVSGDNGKNVSYTLCSGDTLSSAMIDAGFFLDDANNVHYGTFTESESGSYMVGGKRGTITAKTELASDAIAAIADYVTEGDLVDTATSTGTATATSTELPFGYFYITTTTGTAVTIDSNNNNPTVDDKNTIPGKPDKTVTGVSDGSFDEAGQNAVAQVGTTVNFQAEIVKVKGAKGYVFHDKMDEGLSYQNDVKVYLGETEVEAKNYDTTKDAADTLTVTFDDTWLAGLADNTSILIKYSAKVTSDALTVDAAKNTATLEYGNNSKTESDTVNVYNATLTVEKTDGSGAALAGAGFILQNKDTKAYYKIADGVVSWVEDDGAATEKVTEVKDGKAEIAFTGLANGTYVLIEKTTPVGYNTAANSEFTINNANETAEANRTQSTTVVNNAGAELPSTGGIGTTIFYIVGAVLVLGAAAILVARRKVESK